MASPVFIECPQGVSVPDLRADLEWFNPVVQPLPAGGTWVVAALELHRRCDGHTAIIRGHGAGPDVKARAAAIGELAERFVASDPRVHATLVRDVPGAGRVIPPEQAHPARHPMREGWVLGVGTWTGDPVWLPASTVLLGWQRDPAFVDATGLAAAATWEAAVAAATGEVRERDAVGGWWRGALGCTGATLPEHVQRPLTSWGLCARLGRIRTSSDTAVVACVYGPAGGATVGSSWGPQADHALAEALMVRVTVTEHLRTSETAPGLADGLRRLVWGWQHPVQILARFRQPASGASRAAEDAEPIVVRLGRIAPTPLGPLHVVRVVIPGAYRLESTIDVPHVHPDLAHESVASPHPFG